MRIAIRAARTHSFSFISITRPRQHHHLLRTHILSPHISHTPPPLIAASMSSSASPPRPVTPDPQPQPSTTPPGQPPLPKISFPLSPIPDDWKNGPPIRTAAALIIGDEILNGKTHDRNSHYFAKYCFDNGIELKRIEVIADNEDEIIEASRRLVKNYDFVITSGGIGPTHDDIAYASLAKSFSQTLIHSTETIHRMNEINKHRAASGNTQWVATRTPEQLAATHRMALFPERADVLFVGEDIWVPVIRLEQKLCVFPGIPALFQRMLNALTPFLPLPPKDQRPLRIQIFTDRPESMIAPYLTSLAERLKPHGIQVGSYPVLYKGVFVSLIGRDLDPEPPVSSTDSLTTRPQKIWLADVAREVEREVGGRVASEEDVERWKKESAEVALAKARAAEKENTLKLESKF